MRYATEAGAFLNNLTGAYFKGFISASVVRPLFCALEGTVSPLFHRGERFSYRLTDSLFRTENGSAKSNRFRASLFYQLKRAGLFCEWPSGYDVAGMMKSELTQYSLYL